MKSYTSALSAAMNNIGQRRHGVAHHWFQRPTNHREHHDDRTRDAIVLIRMVGGKCPPPWLGAVRRATNHGPVRLADDDLRNISLASDLQQRGCHISARGVDHFRAEASRQAEAAG